MSPSPAIAPQAERGRLVTVRRYQGALRQGPTATPGTTAPAFRHLLEAQVQRSAATLSGQTAAAFVPTAIAVGQTTAAIRGISQTDVREYASAAEASRWGGSSCSAASLTAVLRASGAPVRVGEVVRALEQAGGITVAQGLVSRPALVQTARRFGLTAEDRAMTYDQLVAASRSGPVLVDVTNGKFPEGHWLVVTGADERGVSVADSSGYRLTRLTKDELVAGWSGRGVRLQASTGTARPVGS